MSDTISDMIDDDNVIRNVVKDKHNYGRESRWNESIIWSQTISAKLVLARKRDSKSLGPLDVVGNWQ